MYIPFESLPEYSRIWVYQASRRFTAAEEKVIEAASRSFCDQWEAHGSPLKTSYKIERSQFLILAVDEGVSAASGCSIDGSVRMLKSLAIQTGIDFLDRTNVALLVNDTLKLIPLTKLKQVAASGILGPGTLTFDPQVGTKGSWERDWIVPVEKSWLAKYLP